MNEFVIQPTKPNSRSLLVACIFATLAWFDSPAFGCTGGPDLSNDDMCKYVVHYVDEGKSSVDDNVASRIAPENETALPVRSYALIVDVNSYPNFLRKEDRYLAPAKNDLTNLVTFFKEQKFEEIIVLENADATRSNIEYFLRDYLKGASRARGKRSRIVFAFSGHGSSGATPSDPGAIVLSLARHGTDADHIMLLNELAPLLSNVAKESYHFLALIGSCYSGGIFPNVDSTFGTNNVFPRARGAHAVSATTADDLAYGLDENHGSLFFDSFIDGINTGWADPIYAGLVSFEDGKRQIVGGGIARLGPITAYISGRLDQSLNPRTGKPFPQIRSGSLYSGEGGGAFFFLVPKASGMKLTPTDAPVSSTSQIEVSLASESTGSALQDHPNIKVFSAPDSYEITGIDISHHSGRINWEKVKAAKVEFAYMKATEGGTFVDKRFKENWNNARELGIARGAYHVVNFCRDADSQFQHIRNVVPNDKDAMPVVIDLEWFKDGPRAGAQRKCKDVRSTRKMLRKLLINVAEYYQKPPMIFAHEHGVRELLAGEFNDYALWLQDWTKDGTSNAEGPQLSGTNPWTLWQFAGNTRFAGIANADVNAFFGSREQFELFKAGTPNIALRVAYHSQPQ
ncbi:hypothetical protein CN176_03605 [Sinorhizobium medicae]|uniref:GH25 family lysozyme n=1 Tax=Sinorhizobium medicae TaxID=110321 RepID=UPI000FD995E0|nr:GH25 family lysozyme [Sinorhizobium medicae]RVJ45878.1 hypothetical protein CN176_03605 [Sinorhizobium medicae]